MRRLGSLVYSHFSPQDDAYPYPSSGISSPGALNAFLEDEGSRLFKSVARHPVVVFLRSTPLATHAQAHANTLGVGGGTGAPPSPRHLLLSGIASAVSAAVLAGLGADPAGGGRTKHTPEPRPKVFDAWGAVLLAKTVKRLGEILAGGETKEVRELREEERLMEGRMMGGAATTDADATRVENSESDRKTMAEFDALVIRNAPGWRKLQIVTQVLEMEGVADLEYLYGGVGG